MNLQTALKLLLASSVAACCVATANAQTVDEEINGTVSSLQGSGWGSGNLGNPVTLDFKYDAGAETNSLLNGIFTISAPISSASIVGGALGSGINLEPDGPGTGTVSDSLNVNTGANTISVVTGAGAPDGGFTGSVFGLSLFADGIHTTVEVVRNAFSSGVPNLAESGTAFLSNVTLVPGGQAPEIDPASAFSAMTLLLGSLAVIRGKKFAKVPSA